MNIEITSIKKAHNGGQWITGKAGHFTFQAKVYDDVSHYGINGGRISKLWIKGLYNYDRGIDFDKTPAGMVDSLVGFLEEAPAA